VGYVLASVLAGLIGVACGWLARTRVWAWCTRCGCTVGSVCIDCRDRERHMNRTNIVRRR
jgi:hypothetical protein